jgi:hypothetical protein
VTVLNIKTARAIWLVDARDLNSRGIDIWPMLVAIKDRYNFQAYPKTVEEANENNPNGIIFTNGSFAVGSSRHTIVKATSFGDGVVVDSTLSTDFCEAFLADVLKLLSSLFALTYRPEMIHTKIYTSGLIVHFEPAGFGFSIDTQASTAKPVPFKFEREVNKRFSQQRYYSSAPLRTNQHEDLLKQMESLL